MSEAFRAWGCVKSIHKHLVVEADGERHEALEKANRSPFLGAQLFFLTKILWLSIWDSGSYPWNGKHCTGVSCSYSAISSSDVYWKRCHKEERKQDGCYKPLRDSHPLTRVVSVIPLWMCLEADRHAHKVCPTNTSVICMHGTSDIPVVTVYAKCVF